MKSIVVDLNRCNGCFNCQIACKDEHCGNDWSPIAVPQPTTGQFWCHVDQHERGRIPVVKVAYTPTFCGMCKDAPCLAAAENDAVYRREDGLIIIDPEKARGQKQLVESCPLGMIYYNDELDVAQKCTGCAHLLDDGWSEPRCVDACATGALRIMDNDEARKLEGAQAVDALEGLGSHVYYLNVPKRFIAATVADRERNEVIIGATVTLFDAQGGVVERTETDEFGDLRFEQVEAQAYDVLIEAEGCEEVRLHADCTNEDVVFDDVFVTAGVLY